jgi:hypothetical protein
MKTATGSSKPMAAFPIVPWAGPYIKDKTMMYLEIPKVDQALSQARVHLHPSPKSHRIPDAPMRPEYRRARCAPIHKPKEKVQ